MEERKIIYKLIDRQGLLDIAKEDLYSMVKNYNFSYYAVFFRINNFKTWLNNKKDKIKHCIVLISTYETHYVVMFKKKSIEIFYCPYDAEFETLNNWNYVVKKYAKYYHKAIDDALNKSLLETQFQEVNKNEEIKI